LLPRILVPLAGGSDDSAIFVFAVTQALIGALVLFLVIKVCLARAQVRRAFAIPGSECGDCCLSYWCTCCVVTQMYRHTRPLTNSIVSSGKMKDKFIRSPKIATIV
jgi:hypothetical protein